jgi:MFS transporter, DHA1 family, tetracycline resistance protein
LNDSHHGPANEMNKKTAHLPRRAAFAFVFVTVLLDMLAIGIIIPVLPKLVVDFVGGDAVEGARVYGLFGTVWALMQFAFSPVQGALSDRFGRRPVILISNFGLGLDYVVMALAPSLSWLFLGRVISGITAASISTSYAYIADVTPADKRAARFGLLGAAFGMGFVLGPALGGFTGAVDPRLPFWIAAGLSLANALYGFFVLPESLPPERRSAFAWRRANPVGALTLLRSQAALIGLAGVNFLGNLAHAALPSVSVLYMMYRYGSGTNARSVSPWRASASLPSWCKVALSGRPSSGSANAGRWSQDWGSGPRALRYSASRRQGRCSGAAFPSWRCGVLPIRPRKGL